LLRLPVVEIRLGFVIPPNRMLSILSIFARQRQPDGVPRTHLNRSRLDLRRHSAIIVQSSRLSHRTSARHSKYPMHKSEALTLYPGLEAFTFILFPYFPQKHNMIIFNAAFDVPYAGNNEFNPLILAASVKLPKPEEVKIRRGWSDFWSKGMKVSAVWAAPATLVAMVVMMRWESDAEPAGSMSGEAMPALDVGVSTGHYRQVDVGGVANARSHAVHPRARTSARRSWRLAQYSRHW
jgi:hypothetical protein